MYFLLAVVAYSWPRIRLIAIPAVCAVFAVIEYNITSQKPAGANPTLIATVSRFVYFFFDGATINLLAKRWHPNGLHGIAPILLGIIIITTNGKLPYIFTTWQPPL
jgi:uncharacterized membrane protein YhaH (DUF805 family)